MHARGRAAPSVTRVAICHDLRVSRFARRTTEKRETARSLRYKWQLCTAYSGHINVKVRPNENTSRTRLLRAMAEQEEKRNTERANESDEWTAIEVLFNWNLEQLQVPVQ